jgi:hypothetical protein
MRQVTTSLVGISLALATLFGPATGLKADAGAPRSECSVIAADHLNTYRAPAGPCADCW